MKCCDNSADRHEMVNVYMYILVSVILTFIFLTGRRVYLFVLVSGSTIFTLFHLRLSVSLYFSAVFALRFCGFKSYLRFAVLNKNLCCVSVLGIFYLFLGLVAFLLFF